MIARVLAAFLALAVPAALAQQPADERAFAAIDTCIERLDPVVDIGFEKIAARCPDLAATLERTGWAAWLPEGWKDSRNDLSPGSLAELRKLVDAELRNATHARTPRVQKLQEILANLGQDSTDRSGVWARFKQWVRSVFEPNADEIDEGWFARMRGRIGLSQTFIELLTYAALGFIVLMAALIVVNEIRAAGLLSGRRKRRADAGSAELLAAEHMQVSWQDFERATLREKSRLLLELVAARLVALGQLPPASALTVRELTRAARLPDDTDRARLSRLAFAAERARYARESATEELLAPAVEGGRELFGRLAPGAKAGARQSPGS
jgi:hypothetical protein